MTAIEGNRASVVSSAHVRVHSTVLCAARAAAVFAPLTAGCIEPIEPEPVAEVTSALTVCADGATVEGIDVSKWQGTIDWDAVADAGIRFAFIRTTHGLGILDERYAYNWSEARRVGILRGTYQYFAPDEDPVAQADALLDRMGPLEDGDLPPVLDVEEADGRSPAQIVDAIHAWTDRVQGALGVTPIIYTAKYFWQDSVGAPADFLDHSLWAANWNVACPVIADPWTRWDFWQYSSTGSVPGISTNIDRDVWNGTEDELHDFAWSPPVEPPPDLPPGTGKPPTLGDDPPADDPGDAPGAGGCSTGRGGGLLAVALALVFARRRRASADHE